MGRVYKTTYPVNAKDGTRKPKKSKKAKPRPDKAEGKKKDKGRDRK